MQFNFLRFSFLLLALCCSASLIAQFDVTGTVKDAAGTPLIGVVRLR